MKTEDVSNGGVDSGKKYAELLCDFMFKRLFGSEANKDVLIGFLNMLLQDSEIVDVDFIPTEHLGLTEEDRKVIFDISCKCKNGASFIIEMQKGYQNHFRERALYYTTYPINEQGRHARDLYIKEKAEGKAKSEFSWDYDLKPVTVISILNFSFKHSQDWPDEKYHSSYRLWEDTCDELMTDVLRFVFLELGRFEKYIWQLNTIFEKWMYLLRHIHEMTSIPDEFSEPLFKRLFMLAEIDKFTPEEKKQYIKSLENMGDFRNIINTAAEEAKQQGYAEGREAGRAEGFAEGQAQGMTQGMAQGIAEVAGKMLAAGMSIEEITCLTGLSDEDARQLAE